MNRRLLLLLFALVPVACVPAPAEAPLLPAARAALADASFGWETTRAGDLRLHARAGTAAATAPAAFLRAAERARADGLALLGTPDAAVPLDLFFVATRDEMARLVGRPLGGSASTADRTAFFVHDAERGAALRHEVMHVLSWELWGTPAGGWVSEGLATYAAGTCAGFDLHGLAAALRAEGRLVPLHELAHRFRELDDVDAYLQAASLVRFVHETDGRVALRALWMHGLEAATLYDAAWRAHLDSVLSAPPGWEAVVRARGCEAVAPL